MTPETGKGQKTRGLTTAFSNGDENTLLLQAQQQDKVAMNALMSRYIPLCDRIASDFDDIATDMEAVEPEDFRQQAEEELLKAVQRYATGQTSRSFCDFARDRIETGLRWYVDKRSRFPANETGYNDSNFARPDMPEKDDPAGIDLDADHNIDARNNAWLAIARSQLEPRENAVLEWSLTDEPDLSRHEIALINCIRPDEVEDYALQAMNKVKTYVERMQHYNNQAAPK